MNNPERLLRGAADEHERALLAAAASEEPSAVALVRLQRTLGLTIDPAPLTSLRRPPETSPAALPSRSLFTSKWLLLGSAGLAVVGALALGRAARSPRTPAASSPISLPAPPSLRSRAEAARASAEVAPASTNALEPRADDTSGPALTPPALRDEVLRLELARKQLRSRRARAAENALDEYDRMFPHGTLREEAMALRIEALFAQHEQERARELAATFFATYPDSVHGTRLRRKLEQTGAR